MIYPLLPSLLPIHTKTLRVNFIDYFLESTFHFSVPEAEDQGVQHGSDYSIEYRCYFVPVHGLTRTGLQVHEDDCAIEDRHRSEVGRQVGKEALQKTSCFE